MEIKQAFSNIVAAARMARLSYDEHANLDACVKRISDHLAETDAPPGIASPPIAEDAPE